MKKAIHLFIGFSISIAFIFSFSVAKSQDGSPFQTDFKPDDESLKKDNYSICQNNEGVIIIANRKGILTFDAQEWRIVKTPELPLVVGLDPKSKKIFIGCRNSAGYLSKSQTGEYIYNEIAKNKAGTVLQIVFSGEYVYMLSQTAITRYNPSKSNDIVFWESTADKHFSFMFEVNGKLYTDILGEGLKIVTENGLKPSNIAFPLSGRINFSAEFDKQSVLLGTIDNKLFLFNSKTITPFQIQDQQYIIEGGLIDGKALDNDNIVLATSNSGCLVFNKKTRQTAYTINFQSGLPDDEIMALGIDKNHGIWLAHNEGLTRVDAGIPLKNYSSYKGANGTFQFTAIFNNKLFVAGSNGVYFLEKKKDYGEYLIKENQTTTASISSKKQSGKSQILTKPTNTALTSENKEENKGFFSKLFSRKQKAATEQASQPTADENGNVRSVGGSEQMLESKTIKKTYLLVSESHMYSKVQGFDSKAKQLLEFDGHLLVYTQNGIFDIKETNAKQIYKGNSINYIYGIKSENTVLVCNDKGLSKLILSGDSWKEESFNVPISEPIYSVVKDMFDNYWLGSENKVIKIRLKHSGELKERKDFQFKSEYREKVIVRLSNKKPIFFFSKDIYSIFNDSIQLNLWLSKYSGQKSKIFYKSQQDYTILCNNKKWISLSASDEPDSISPNFLNLFDNINQVYTDNNKNLWVINENDRIYKIDTKSVMSYESSFNTFIKRFYGTSGETFSLDGVTLERNQDNLKLIISAPYFIKANSNQYQFKLKGGEWSEWNTDPIKVLYFARTGNFEITARARNIFGKISNEVSLKYTIEPPFYQSWWFYILCVIAGIYFVYLIIKFRERDLKNKNEILEEKVHERTKQIEKQKEEIEFQSSKIQNQNKEITDSIRYAKRIQIAVMPDNDLISNLFPESFVLFRPKDIVSGDFYWVKKIKDKIIVAAADCTGHGVPGGFLSMLGVSLLNEISVLDHNYNANEILELLRTRVINTLISEGHDENETKDGMDIALCIIEPKLLKIQYAGANNPLYLIRNKEIIEYSADKMPIGSFAGKKNKFSNNEIQLEKNDQIVIFSDGYRDQMGGLKEKRMKSSGFKQILLDVNEHPMNKQKELLEAYLDEWRGENEQIDDIMVFGIKV